jgi:hypothetical protein
MPIEALALAKPEHLVTMRPIDDGAEPDESLRVIWEVEPGARALERLGERRLIRVLRAASTALDVGVHEADLLGGEEPAAQLGAPGVERPFDPRAGSRLDGIEIGASFAIGQVAQHRARLPACEVAVLEERKSCRTGSARDTSQGGAARSERAGVLTRGPAPRAGTFIALLETGLL